MQSNHPPIWSGSIPSKRHPLPRLLRVVCGSLLLIGLMHLTFSIFALEGTAPQLLAQGDEDVDILKPSR